MSVFSAAIYAMLFTSAAMFSRRLARVRPGSLFSACMILFLRDIFSLRDMAQLLAVENEYKPPVCLQKISHHAMQSLNIAARFNSLIILLFRSFRNPEPRFS